MVGERSNRKRKKVQSASIPCRRWRQQGGAKTREEKIDRLLAFNEEGLLLREANEEEGHNGTRDARSNIATVQYCLFVSGIFLRRSSTTAQPNTTLSTLSNLY